MAGSKNCDIAIKHVWSWGGLISNVTIDSCTQGIQSTTGTRNLTDQHVNGVTLSDFVVKNTPTLLNVSLAQGSFVLDNVITDNVPAIVLEASAVVLAGSTGSTTVKSWARGQVYTGTSATPATAQGTVNLPSRPASLVTGDSNFFFGKARPQYQDAMADDFVSARDGGAVGDGKTDDTAALQAVINAASQNNKILYIPHGFYLITSTLNIPIGSRIHGEYVALQHQALLTS
jgi:glucan 1,3-beta-glucosidase